MPVYNLIKNGKVVNTIIADEVDSIRDQYDDIEEVIPPEPTPPIPTINDNTVRSHLTFSEKVKWDNNATPSIVTAKIEFSSPRTVEDATEVLNFLVSEGDISRTSADKILASV